MNHHYERAHWKRKRCSWWVMYGIIDLFGILAGRTLIRVSVIHSVQSYLLNAYGLLGKSDQ